MPLLLLLCQGKDPESKTGIETAAAAAAPCYYTSYRSEFGINGEERLIKNVGAPLLIYKGKKYSIGRYGLFII